jgi:DNA-binding response OmpR family regulator
MGGKKQAMKNRILLVDDNDDVRQVFQEGLEERGFEVVPASTLNEALTLISAEKFGVPVSEKRRPDGGEGFRVVSALCHPHTSPVTLVLSDLPALQEAMGAILLKADEVRLKTVGTAEISEIITKRLSIPSARVAMMAMKKEHVAIILERETISTIQIWISHVEGNKDLAGITLTYEERAAHLLLLLGDIVRRLRLASNAAAPISKPAREHGSLRRKQGYTIPMMVEESRLLQASIFRTLRSNLGSTDSDTLLSDVMTIADEVDSQLKQSLLGYIEDLSLERLKQCGL